MTKSSSAPDPVILRYLRAMADQQQRAVEERRLAVRRMLAALPSGPLVGTRNGNGRDEG